MPVWNSGELEFPNPGHLNKWVHTLLEWPVTGMFHSVMVMWPKLGQVHPKETLHCKHYWDGIGNS
jgi:hypothetical protein